jgi:hypothetical protein
VAGYRSALPRLQLMHRATAATADVGSPLAVNDAKTAQVEGLPELELRATTTALLSRTPWKPPAFRPRDNTLGVIRFHSASNGFRRRGPRVPIGRAETHPPRDANTTLYLRPRGTSILAALFNVAGCCPKRRADRAAASRACMNGGSIPSSTGKMLRNYSARSNQTSVASPPARLGGRHFPRVGVAELFGQEADSHW